MKPEHIIDRATQLKQMHDDALPDRARFRAILNGGEDGIRELLGPNMDRMDASMIPAPNLILSALDRLAQKLGKMPTLDVHITNGRDSARNKIKKEKLERIVTSYDRLQELDAQLPQVARWLPGYGFAVWVITTKKDMAGNIYPTAELRNPYDCFPGYFGNGQDPKELAIIQRVPVSNLIEMYPELKSWFKTREENKASNNYNVYNFNNDGSWENSDESGDVLL